MAHSTSTMSKKDRAEQHAEEGARQARPWVKKVSQLGYATKGLVYAIIGVLAAQAAFGTGGQTTGSSGALIEIVTQPFGRVLLSIVAVGLAGYALWRFVEAAIDPDQQGSDAKGIGKRLSYVVSGILYAGLAFTAVQIIMGSGGGGGNSTQHWTARLMSQPFGVWLVGIVGVLVIGTGLYQIYKGLSAKFREKMIIGQMSQREETVAVNAGRVGLTARGIVIGLIGVFLMQAAWQAQPSEAKGLGATLQEIAQQPYGPWLMGIVALGLIAYGIFMGFMARYRKMDLS